MTAPYWSNGVSTLYNADARSIPLPDKSVHTVITSPPYLGLRNYGLGQWQGGSNPDCVHARDREHEVSLRTSTINYAKQTGHSEEPWPNHTCGLCGATFTPSGIGNEPTLAEHCRNLLAVFDEVRRVLRDDGTLWLNYGDSYAGSNQNNVPIKGGARAGYSERGNHGMGRVDGLPAKNLIGMPWRIAFALQDAGWILRSAIVWHKPNPMPESATDRPTNSYENLFLFAKQGKYYYDQEAVREPAPYGRGTKFHTARYTNNHAFNNSDDSSEKGAGRHYGIGGRNIRNVWTIPTQSYPDAHFATFPEDLVKPCILAGTPEHGACSECGRPYERQVKLGDWQDHPERQNRTKNSGGNLEYGADGYSEHGKLGKVRERKTIGWTAGCPCAVSPVPATVLDPFAGSGTTLAVAQKLGRNSIGLDLNPKYLELAQKRLEPISLPML